MVDQVTKQAEFVWKLKQDLFYKQLKKKLYKIKQNCEYQKRLLERQKLTQITQIHKLHAHKMIQKNCDVNINSL